MCKVMYSENGHFQSENAKCPIRQRNYFFRVFFRVIFLYAIEPGRFVFNTNLVSLIAQGFVKVTYVKNGQTQ